MSRKGYLFHFNGIDKIRMNTKGVKARIQICKIFRFTNLMMVNKNKIKDNPQTVYTKNLILLANLIEEITCSGSKNLLILLLTLESLRNFSYLFFISSLQKNNIKKQ